MTDTELAAKGWSQAGDYWYFPTDGGFSHQRAHTRNEAIQRTTKAVLKQRRIADVWVLSPRSNQDGIEMGFIHQPRIAESELAAFYETIPESMRVHLTESQVEEEYRHHYGKP